MANDLVTLTKEQFPALDPNNEHVALMVSNLGGEQLSVDDFTRIKVPTGGGTKWMVSSAAGDEAVATLRGVIVYTTRRRAYWSNPNPSNQAPDCASSDMLIGLGDPGGECAKCPMNAFGSAVNGHGKACKEARLLFLLREGRVLPDVVAVPPGSLKQVRKYLLDISQVGVPYSGAITELSLEKANNQDNIAYARIVPRMAAQLDEATYRAVVAMIGQYRDTFENVSTRMDDVETEEV